MALIKLINILTVTSVLTYVAMNLRKNKHLLSLELKLEGL